MTMTRRLFASLLASMPVLAAELRLTRKPTIPVLVGDGVTDDSDALNAWGRGEPVMHNGKLLGATLFGLDIAVSRGITVSRQDRCEINSCRFRYTGPIYRLDSISLSRP